MIYLDNAATTKLDPRVLDAMLPFYKEEFGNPSSIHGPGRRARAAIERARKSIARQLNASTGEIFFTSGGTESNNVVLKHAVKNLGVERIITSQVEHHCVLHTAEYLMQQGVQVDFVPVDSLGYFNLEVLEQMLRQPNQKTLISLIHANNEIGTINDIIKIGDLAKKYDAYFHADTVQSVAHYTLDLQEIPVDFISGGAHKFHGPKGVGFLYINNDVSLEPIFHGGAQERNMRAGTENVAQIVGMAEAMTIAYNELEEDQKYIQGLKDYLIQQLLEQFENIDFNGDISHKSLYTVLNVNLPIHMTAELLLFNLDINGIAASVGSACSSGADKGSHVLQALNKNRKIPAVRFSFAKENTKEELDQLIEVLRTIMANASKKLV